METEKFAVEKEKDISLMGTQELKKEKAKSKEAIKNLINKINRNTKTTPVYNPAATNAIKVSIEKSTYLFPKPCVDYKSDTGRSIYQDKNLKNSLDQLRNKNRLLENNVIPEKIKENNHLKKSINEAQK